MDHIKKHLYWDKYGVKTFPYRGKRKYFPCIYQDYDGTFMIRNDVFGLTIAQFEREFKELLARRKENESHIQNVRFPDKKSKEYIEYLKCGDDTIQSYIRVRELFDEDRHFRSLVQMAGTERDIRIRQRMFILIDSIYNIPNKLLNISIHNISIGKSFRHISSGSLAEGIDLPGSDIDIMFRLDHITVIDDINILNLSSRKTTLMMENDIHYPGFCKLKLVAESYNQDSMIANSLYETEDGMYLGTDKFLRPFLNFDTCKDHSLHGPCISDANQNIDYAICLGTECWPNNAFNWCNRHRKSQWPSYTVIDSILKEGCLLVPIAPRNSENKLLWRISFSMAEKRLTHSMNYTQLLCYVLLKLTLKNIINNNEEVKELLCSYFLKTTVFWLSEEIYINTFTICNLSHCYFLCIDKLASFVKNCNCPNYFIPRQNMFIGKIDDCNSKPLLSILIRLRNTELSVIMASIFDSNVMYEESCPFKRNGELSMNLELLFYRVSVVRFKNVESACTALQYIKSLMKSESSEFILGVLRFYNAIINQLIPQMLVLPDRRHERYTTIRRFHKYLMEGTKSDAVSGWLFYASFHYVLGDYKKTLQIVHKVLSRCTPDMILLGQPFYTPEDKNNYKHKTEGHLTLNHKMRQGTLFVVHYVRQSTLIPQELQLEVQGRYPLLVPPVVMSQCLQFLCYHHLGNVNNKQRTLRELYLTIKEGYFVSRTQLSNSFVILGVCNEVSGDKDTAYHCYNDALHCDSIIRRSAEQRLANLFLTK